MHAAHKNNEPTGQASLVSQEQVVGGLPSINPVASSGFLDPAQLPCAATSPASASPAPSGSVSPRPPISETLKAWAPVVVAIVVPGGIVIALAMLVRRWYRARAVRPATFA